MAGQPRPSTVLPWAVETLYPVTPHLWGGQPCKATPPADYFTPQISGQPIVPAEYLNEKFSDTAKSLQAAQDWIGNTPALVWNVAFLSNVFGGLSVGQIQAVRYEANASVRQWLVSVTYGPAAPANFAALYASSDQGQTWQLIGGNVIANDASGFLSQCACVDPSASGQYLAATSFAGTPAAFQVNLGTSSSWVNVYQDLTIQPTSLNVATIGSTAIFSYTVSGSPGKLLWTNNGGTTWQPKLSVESAAPEWLLAVSPPGPVQQVLAMPLRVAKSSVGTYYAGGLTTTTPNVLAGWTAQSLPTQMGSFDQVLALTWATTPLGQCWIMPVMGWKNDGSAPIGVQFYASGDGATWFLLPGGPEFLAGYPYGYHSGMQSGIEDIASIGGLLIAAGDPASDQSGPSRLYFSVDGAITWHDTQSSLRSNAVNTTVGWSRTRLAASDFGFLAANTNWGRFSMCAGLPSVTY